MVGLGNFEAGAVVDASLHNADLSTAAAAPATPENIITVTKAVKYMPPGDIKALLDKGAAIATEENTPYMKYLIYGIIGYAAYRYFFKK